MKNHSSYRNNQNVKTICVTPPPLPVRLRLTFTANVNTTLICVSICYLLLLDDTHVFNLPDDTESNQVQPLSRFLWLVAHTHPHTQHTLALEAAVGCFDSELLITLRRPRDASEEHIPLQPVVNTRSCTAQTLPATSITSLYYSVIYNTIFI